MKNSILILIFSVVCGYSVNAQSASTKKNAQITEPVELTSIQVQASTTATMVSGSRNAVIREVPLEKNEEASEQKTEIISSERKPR